MVSLSRVAPAVPLPLALLSYPPPICALLANRVLLVSVMVALVPTNACSEPWMPPPARAVLPSKVEPVTAAVMEPPAARLSSWYARPPPRKPATLPSTVELVSDTLIEGVVAGPVVWALTNRPPPSAKLAGLLVLPEMVLLLIDREVGPCVLVSSA